MNSALPPPDPTNSRSTQCTEVSTLDDMGKEKSEESSNVVNVLGEERAQNVFVEN